MKTHSTGYRPLRREQLLKELVHDSYKSKRKLAEPATCPECGAAYRHGRWIWGDAPADAHKHLCPACHRIRDKFPAGYITLKGNYQHEHHDDIVQTIRHCEAREKAEHPLERIMEINANAEEMVVTTTDTHLARAISERLHDAFKGDLEFHYNKEDNLLRVTWNR